MNELIDKVKLSCKLNYQFTIKRFEMIKRTPKENNFVFLPLTKEETIHAWEEGIRLFKIDC